MNGSAIQKEYYAITLWGWIKKTTKPVLGIIAGTVGISFVIDYLMKEVHKDLSADDFKIWITSLQLCVCLLMFFVSIYKMTKPATAFSSRKPEVQAACAAVRYFSGWWRALWAVWVLLYIALLFDEVNDEHKVAYLKTGLTFIEHQFNALSGICLFMLFHTMSTHTDWKVNPREPAPNSIRHMEFYWISIFLILGAVEYFFVFPGILNLDATYDEIFRDYDFLYVAAVASATFLFASRLGSAYLGLPRLIFYPLVVYGAIQPLFGFVGHAVADCMQPVVVHDMIYKYFPNSKGDNSIPFFLMCDLDKYFNSGCEHKAVTYGIQEAMFIYAMLGKILLAISVYWAYDSGRLHFYMAKASGIKGESTEKKIYDWLVAATRQKKRKK